MWGMRLLWMLTLHSDNQKVTRERELRTVLSVSEQAWLIASLLNCLQIYDGVNNSTRNIATLTGGWISTVTTYDSTGHQMFIHLETSSTSCGGFYGLYEVGKCRPYEMRYCQTYYCCAATVVSLFVSVCVCVSLSLYLCLCLCLFLSFSLSLTCS